jgi:hypothetical protein
MPFQVIFETVITRKFKYMIFYLYIVLLMKVQEYIYIYIYIYNFTCIRIKNFLFFYHILSTESIIILTKNISSNKIINTFTR